MATLIPKDVYRGNPASTDHQVIPTQAQQLAEQMIEDTTEVTKSAAALGLRADALEASQTTNQITTATWVDLLAVAGTLDGQGGEVLDSDLGTHLAASGAGYDGTSVNNAGRYSWSALWSRWIRIGDTGLANVVRGGLTYGGDYDILLAGSDGYGVAAFGHEKAKIGAFTFEPTTRGRMAIIGSDRFVFGELAFVGDISDALATEKAPTTLWMGQDLFGIDGEEFGLYTAGLLEDRADVQRVRINLIGSDGFSRSGTDQIQIRPDLIGPTASLQTRERDDAGGEFSELVVSSYSAPKNPVTGGAPVILSIGDSITYRSGAAWAAHYLLQWGYTPNFIGTLQSLAEGVAVAQDSEGKAGHALRDMTYDVTSRVSPLPPGDEATYDGLGTAAKELFNTFLRAETGGDAPGDVRNGYVVDFANYISRHALPTPTILWHGYGTNDIRDELAVNIEGKIYSEDSLIYRRWFADYPTAPVVRWLPGTAWGDVHNDVWAEKYIPTIRGMIRAAQDATGPVLLVPTWAMHTTEGGFDLSHTPAPDPVTGETLRTLEDPIHPTGGTRRALFHALAAGLACAATSNHGV